MISRSSFEKKWMIRPQRTFAISRRQQKENAHLKRWANMFALRQNVGGSRRSSFQTFSLCFQLHIIFFRLQQSVRRNPESECSYNVADCLLVYQQNCSYLLFRDVFVFSLQFTMFARPGFESGSELQPGRPTAIGVLSISIESIHVKMFGNKTSFRISF